MENYLKMNDRQKQQTQERIFRQLRMLQSRHFETEGVRVPLKLFYKNAIENSVDSEDYEMCQALKDSAQKYMIDWND